MTAVLLQPLLDASIAEVFVVGSRFHIPSPLLDLLDGPYELLSSSKAAPTAISPFPGKPSDAALDDLSISVESGDDSQDDGDNEDANDDDDNQDDNDDDEDIGSASDEEDDDDAVPRREEVFRLGSDSPLSDPVVSTAVEGAEDSASSHKVNDDGGISGGGVEASDAKSATVLDQIIEVRSFVVAVVNCASTHTLSSQVFLSLLCHPSPSLMRTRSLLISCISASCVSREHTTPPSLSSRQSHHLCVVGSPLHPLFRCIVNRFVVSSAESYVPISLNEGVCSAHPWSRHVSTFLAATAYAIIMNSCSPSSFSSSASISLGITEAVARLITLTELSANPELRNIVPSVEVCCLFFFRARLSSNDYSTLMKEMEQFIGCVVESSHENLMQTCNSLPNAEILLMFLQNPPSVVCTDPPPSWPLTDFSWIPCPLSLTRLRTSPAPAKEPAAAKEPSAVTTDSSEIEGFWSTSLEPICELVSIQMPLFLFVSYCLAP